MKVIGKEKDMIDLLPEEMQAEAIIEIKNLLKELLKTPIQEKLLSAINQQLNILAETLKENKVMEWQHTPIYDNMGRIERIISTPIRIRLKLSK